MEGKIDLLLNQKLHEIRKLEEKFNKLESEDTGKTNALIFQVIDTERTQEKLENEVKKLEARIRHTDTYLGYT